MITSRKTFSFVFGLLIILLLLSILWSISIGQIKISLFESLQVLFSQLTGRSIGQMEPALTPMITDVIWQIRIPRVLLAAVVGSGLALCGTVMQASIQNPLADPYILGISSGASLGATFSIVLGHTFSHLFGSFALFVWAFIGAVLATFVVLLLSNLGGKMSVIKLILAGTVVNALNTSLSNLFVYFAKDAEGVRSVTFWMMGSLSAAEWGDIPLIAIIVLIASLFFYSQWHVMNAMLMGNDAAMTLGINLSLYRKLYLIIAAIVTAVIVATCGIIGFIGLVIPHIIRSFTGANHRFLIPIVIVVGAIFLIWADVLARTIITNSELPIGIVTSLFGAPVFMHILIRKKYNFGGN